MKTVSVVGEGAWGTAIAQLLADNGYRVTLWCYDQQIAHEIANEHTNKRYMPGISMYSAIIPVTDFASIVQNTVIFISTPMQYCRSVLEQLKIHCTSDQLLVMLNKGIENDTLLLPSQLVDEVFGSCVSYAVVAGPSFAKEVIDKCLTAVVVAAKNKYYAQEVHNMLSNEYMHLQITNDVMGVQIGAALKNVIALAMGIAQGVGWCANTKAWVITQGLHEMVTLATVLRGNAQSIYGLSGVGDLILTASNVTSRNYQVGIALGQGKKLNDILAQTGYIPEGVNTAYSVEQLCKRHKIELPICQSIYRYIHENGSIDDITNALLT